ncbi:hypothetical protein PFHG_05335 [Plasmodium falciparum HB3]|uniref:Glycophorin binding protein n=1 Tax=Plasmodium falciparum (isolate HB3) TaxID=137071 RepID=A0A0L7KKV8_PLAFX|nr:hypothetical protein PFHG_05335 [Plasmodium falciparum HB3]
MRLSNATNIKSAGDSNCKNFSSKNSSKYSLMDVQERNEKKSSLSSFHSKQIILIFGIIYVALLNVYICGDKYQQDADYSFTEGRVLAQCEFACTNNTKTSLRKCAQTTTTSADPEGQIMKAWAADPEYRKHINVLYQILTHTDPNDETSADPEGQIMKAWAADPEYRKHVNVLYQILTHTDPNDETSADPEGQIMKAWAADPEYRKHVNVLYQILTNTDPNDESS